MIRLHKRLNSLSFVFFWIFVIGGFDAVMAKPESSPSKASASSVHKDAEGAGSKKEESSHKGSDSSSKTPSQVNLTLYRNGTSIATKKVHYTIKSGRHSVVCEGVPKTINMQSLVPLLDGVGQNLQILGQWIGDDATNLYLDISSTHDHVKPLTLMFMFSGLEWDVSYSGVLSSDQATLSLIGTIELTNQSGVDFKQAQVLFKGGEAELANDGTSVMNQGKGDFSYLLPRVVTLMEGKKQLLNFLQSKAINLRQETIVQVGGDSLADQKNQMQQVPVQRVVEFKNDEEAGLHFSLPEGKIALYQERTNGLNELLGTSTLKETPMGKSVSLRIGAGQEHFGLSCVLDQFEYKKHSGNNSESAYRVILSNKGDSDADVKVLLNFPQCDWDVTRTSQRYEKVEGSNQIYWIISVPKGQTVELKYRLKLDNVRS